MNHEYPWMLYRYDQKKVPITYRKMVGGIGKTNALLAWFTWLLEQETRKHVWHKKEKKLHLDNPHKPYIQLWACIYKLTNVGGIYKFENLQ